MKRTDFISSIKVSADRMAAQYPSDSNMRAKAFIAYLAGMCGAQGEEACERVLMGLLDGDPKPSNRATKG